MTASAWQSSRWAAVTCMLANVGLARLLGNDLEIGLDEAGPSLWREQRFGRVVGEHDLAVEQWPAVGRELRERRTGGPAHEVAHGQHPGAGERFMKLAGRNAIRLDEGQQRLPHVRLSACEPMLHEIHVRQPQVSLVIERCRRDRAGLKSGAKVSVVLGCRMSSHGV